MRRPARARVIEAMKPHVRVTRLGGTNRLIEAVELDSGIMVVEYKFTPTLIVDGAQAYESRKVALFTSFDRPAAFNLQLERTPLNATSD